MLRVQETLGFGDAGYQGIDKRPDAKLFALFNLSIGAQQMDGSPVMCAPENGARALNSVRNPLKCLKNVGISGS